MYKYLILFGLLLIIWSSTAQRDNKTTRTRSHTAQRNENSTKYRTVIDSSYILGAFFTFVVFLVGVHVYLRYKQSREMKLLQNNDEYQLEWETSEYSLS